MTLAARDCIKAVYAAAKLGRDYSYARKAFALAYDLSDSEIKKVARATWGRSGKHRENNLGLITSFIYCRRKGMVIPKDADRGCGAAKGIARKTTGEISHVWINECATIPESAIETIKNRNPI